MLRFVDQVIVPYFQDARKTHGLPADHKGLVIFDVFTAHLCVSLRQKLEENNLKIVYVPAGCTGELQPLDLTVNSFFKTRTKNSFNDWYYWYSAEVSKQLNEGKSISELKVDLNIKQLKPIHAGWIVDAVQHLATSPDIKKGFELAGISDAIKDQ